MPHATDTIAAIATARGQAALAILRMSGPRAVAIAASCFRGGVLDEAASHTAHVGYFYDDDPAQPLDHVVATVFRAPRTATGEDIVEVSCHGGTLLPQRILRTLLDRGARLADPGEFSQRAFLNGKMDLAQAEAVADLIHASSSLAQRVSLAQLQGRYSDRIAALRQELLQTAALVELELDFSEEDVEFADRERLEGLLGRTRTLLTDLLKSARLGALVRDGVRVVIGGRPNAGKSTLLNALVEQDRAIVSDVPGTTRDEIEAEADIGGLLFRFVDTAGLRETEDAIEAEGVRRTRRAIEHADVLLYVYDASEGLTPDEQAFLQHAETSRPDLPTLLIANKIDLVRRRMPRNVQDDTEPSALPHVLLLSALAANDDPEQLAALRRALVTATQADLTDTDASGIVVNERHRQHLQRALEAVEAAQYALAADFSGDALSLDLRQALHELGAITGEITNEHVLDEIFANFCIGK